MYYYYQIIQRPILWYNVRFERAHMSYAPKLPDKSINRVFFIRLFLDLVCDLTGKYTACFL